MGAGWYRPAPDNMGDFSAVCWMFGRRMQAHLGIPVGLIENQVGYPNATCPPIFSATFRPFCAVFSPFFCGFRLPGAKTERTGEKWRKMGEIWGRNGRETAVAEWRWAQWEEGDQFQVSTWSVCRRLRLF